MKRTSDDSAFVAPELAAQAQAFLDVVGPRRMDRNISELREDARSIAQKYGGDAEPVASIADVDADGVPARLYQPEHERGGVLVWLHGGAWMLGGLAESEPVACALANRARCSVLSVDYRLAPEHPYPAGINDCWTATKWALERFDTIAVGGESAGGNLATAVALRARDQGISLAFQLLVYPPLDAELNSPFIQDFIARYTDFAGDPRFGESAVSRLRYIWDIYVPQREGRLDIDAAPLRASSFAGVAPALIILAEHDPLRSDGEQYARRLELENVRVQIDLYPGQMHGFFSLLGAMDDGYIAISRSAAALATAFHGGERADAGAQKDEKTTTKIGATTGADIDGNVEPGFEAVRDAFIANFARGLEVGASCAIYVGGVKVVDLWGGVAEPATGRVWSHDTVAPVNSVSKGVTAACVALLIERGSLSPELPASSYWPEFAARGKHDVTVTELLSHRAGLPVLQGKVAPEDVLDSVRMATRLATQRPIWQPGTTHGYHALTFGALADAIVRRVDGRSLGRFLAEEIAGPLGLALFIGLPLSERARVASLVDPSPQTREQVARSTSDPVMRDAALALFDDAGDEASLSVRAGTLNGALSSRRSTRDPRFYAAEIPAANAVTNARSLARLYAACIGPVDGHRILSEPTLDTVTEEQATGPDAVLHFPTRFGLGFQLGLPRMPLLGPSSFGHQGAGGALGFADRDYHVGFGYVQNQQVGFGAEPRTASLIHAVRRSL